MLFLIQTAQCLLVLLVALLGYRVWKVYSHSLDAKSVATPDIRSEGASSQTRNRDLLNAQESLQAYISDFFADMNVAVPSAHPPHHQMLQTSIATPVSHATATNTRSEFSRKVVDAMINESDWAVAS